MLLSFVIRKGYWRGTPLNCDEHTYYSC